MRSARSLSPLAVTTTGLLLASCASVPPYLKGDGRPPDYPNDRFIVAAGQSNESMEAAKHNAQSQISQQIDSDIHSVFEQVLQSVHEGTANSRSDESSRVTSKVVVESKFSHAELIEYPDTREVGGVYYALGVLPRATASERLAPAYDSAALAFREAVDLARRSPSDAVAFTAAARRACREFDRLVSPGQELAAIDPNRRAAVNADARLLGELRALRQQVLQNTTIRMLPRTNVARELASALATLTPSLGLRVAEEKAALTLDVSVEENWPPSRTGPCVEWTASVSINGTSYPLDAQLTGCHAKDREFARRDLLGRLTSDTLLKPLRTVLATYVPIEEM